MGMCASEDVLSFTLALQSPALLAICAIDWDERKA